MSKKSIAKLELCGANMLSELVDKVLKCVKYKIDNIFYWCYSKIVLSWLNNPSALYKAFVGNRISVIQELSEVGRWFHISGDINSADLISRGTFPTNLVNWIQGIELISEKMA